MAKKGGGDALGALGFAVAVFAVLGLVYSQTGRGKINSLLIPDSLENRIDRVVAALNQKFGAGWVNFGLDVLQVGIQRTMPGVAALVNAVYQVEQMYRYAPRTGGAKKQEALRLLRG